jgi:thiol-disulfide isomerase/thioredoxin
MPILTQPVQPVQPVLPVPVARPKVIAFGAEWCGACRAGQPILISLKRRGVDVERFNIDLRPDLVARYGIITIPVYFVIRSGHETVRTQDIDEVLRLVNEVYGR